MKLFQRLLVAPAALGLLSPMAVSANEVNLNDISNYSDEEIEINSNSFGNYPTSNPLLAGGEGMHRGHDGGFSETTTASFSADFAIGAVDGLGISTGVTDGNEQLTAEYGFQIDLNTSFTGEDSLDIAIDAGNANGNAPLDEFDLNGTTDALTVDGISYTFPLGDSMTVMFGDNIDGSELFTTACAYSGPTDTLDDCGNVNAAITNGGAMVGMSYDFDNGVTAAFGYAGSETGLMTKENADAYGFNVAYTADSYGFSVTYGMLETAQVEDTFSAFNAFWTPEGFPAISVGLEKGEDGSAAEAADETTAWFVGLESSQFGPGTFGAAIGTAGSFAENADEELMYEAYYSYPVNDGMTVTPVVYIKEKATSGTPDQTGVMVKTSFSF